MILADWIAIGIVLVAVLLGFFIGFGKGLKFFTSGIFSFIIGIVICALIGTVFLGVGFVGDLLTQLAANWAGNGILEAIHLEIIIYYIALFIIVEIVIFIVVRILAGILEADNFVSKLVNKILGITLFLVLAVFGSMLALKIVGMVGGETAESLAMNLQHSAFKLDELYNFLIGFNPIEIPETAPEAASLLSYLA